MKNWKTTTAGIAAGSLFLFASAYRPGMTWRDWVAAAGLMLMGILSKDHTE